jgi:hypothetical protein
VHINVQAHQIIRRGPAIERQPLFGNVMVIEDDGFVMEITISEVSALV